MNIVYGLYSSKNRVIRYIGQTKDIPEQRLKRHIKEAKAGKELTYKNYWILDVISKGYRVEIVVLKENAVRNIDEIEHIRFYRKVGIKLTNQTAGGDHSFELTLAAREKMRQRKLGKKLSEEHRKTLSESQKGRIVTIETRRKISQSLRGHKISEETKNKIRNTLKVNYFLRSGKEVQPSSSSSSYH